MKKPVMKINRIISFLIVLLLLILCFLVLMGMPAGNLLHSPSDVTAQEHNPSASPSGTGYDPSGESHSNEYVCSHYFSLLADELDRSDIPFRAGEYESFRPVPPATFRHPLALHASGGGQDATLQRHLISSGMYLPLELETPNGTAVLYTIVAYWLTLEGELKEELVTLGVEMPDGEDHFFLDDPTVSGLRAARASMKPGVVFTATLTSFVSRHGPNWAGCPGSNFADRYGEQACLVGAALAEENPPDVSSGFTGSFLFGWQLERTGEIIPFPICQYIEES